jgi:hypothetical protein
LPTTGVAAAAGRERRPTSSRSAGERDDPPHDQRPCNSGSRTVPEVGCPATGGAAATSATGPYQRGSLPAPSGAETGPYATCTGRSPTRPGGRSSTSSASGTGRRCSSSLMGSATTGGPRCDLPDHWASIARQFEFLQRVWQRRRPRRARHQEGPSDRGQRRHRHLHHPRANRCAGG